MTNRPPGGQRIIIGLTGPNAAGKGEVASYLTSRGFAYHSLSGVLRDELARCGLEPTRENLIAKGNEMRSEGGAGVLAERIRGRLLGRDVVDSIRNPAEVLVLKAEAGFILLGVDAPVELRFQRASRRGRPGEGPSLEAFRSKEARENSQDPCRQQLARTFAMADRIIRNDGSLALLHERLAAVLEELGVAQDGP